MIDTKMRHIIILFISLLFLIKGNYSYGQVIRSEIIGAYIYNFAKLSSSPKQENLKTYNIVLISEQEEIIKEFRKIEKEMQINNKKISLNVSKDATLDFSNTCLVFISSDKSEYYNALFEKTQNNEVLIISENYSVKQKILLNLYDSDDKKLLFEINRGNIYQRQITISNEILLLGGTEIDLVQLYLDSQKKLNESETELDKSRRELNAIQKGLDKLIQQVSESETKVENQKKLLNQQINEREQLTSEINSYQAQLENQKNTFTETRQNLKLILDSLQITNELIQSQKKQIEEGQQILEEQTKDIEKKNKELLLKEGALAEQGVIITRQKYVVLLFATISIFISILIILLFKSFKDKKKKNKLLEAQKHDLNEKNEELETSIEELTQVQQQLVQSEKMASLGVLSAGIAHEINNPINFVYAGINSLLRDFEDIDPIIKEVSQINLNSDNLEEKLKQIENLKKEYSFDEAFKAIPEIISDIKLGADRTAEIVKSLRSFSRSDMGELQSLNIHESIETSLLLLKNKYKNNIEIIKNFAPNIPELRCYSGKINQVFLNLISNAIDSVEEKGKIWITTSKNSSFIRISIKDSGYGMSKDTMDRMFDPFYTTKLVGKGTGLGLSISYGIIQEHDGRIEVKSELGKGSEFIILFPLNNN